MSSFVLQELDPPLATLTLNRPERHNSLVPELLTGLLEGLEAVRARPDLGAVLLQANGRNFSTGGDLRAFADRLDEIEAYAAEIVGLLNRAILAMTALPMPVVAAVQGATTGGSFGLVLAADVVLISPEATFTPYYSVVGFSPDGGWTALLPEFIGLRRAMRVLALNQTIDAAKAVEWGLADRIVPEGKLRDEVLKAARGLAAAPSGVHRRTKRLLAGRLHGLAARLEAERTHFVEQIAAPETQQSMLAFLAQL